jgi:hypothetical protein
LFQKKIVILVTVAVRVWDLIMVMHEP